MKRLRKYLVFDHKQIVRSFSTKKELDKWLKDTEAYHAEHSSHIHSYYVVEAVEYVM